MIQNFNTELNIIISNKKFNTNSSTKIDLDNIIIYGFGNLGKMALDLLKKIKVIPKYIVDKNINKDSPSSKVILPKDISSENLKKATFVLCISALPFNDTYNELKNLGCKNIIQFYDLAYSLMPQILSNGWKVDNIDKNDIINIKLVFSKLIHDDNSAAHFLQFLWWRLYGIEKIYPNYPVLSNKKYFKAPSMPKLNKNEVFFDGGAHFGTTIQSFLDITNNNFKSIWAIEPDPNNLNVLKKNLTNISNLKYIQLALSNKNGTDKFIDDLGFASKIERNGNKTINTQTIDSLNINPTIIKLHLEGYELQALEGAKNTISKFRPIVMVLADHNEDGLYKIATFLINLEAYKLYFYLHDYCGNSAIYYAIPKERCVE